MRAQLEEALQKASLAQVDRDEEAMELGRRAWALCDAATAGARVLHLSICGPYMPCLYAMQMYVEARPCCALQASCQAAPSEREAASVIISLQANCIKHQIRASSQRHVWHPVSVQCTAAEKVAGMPGLAGQLTEQLRVLLEPTQARRMAGDYSSGKRISMRKVCCTPAPGPVWKAELHALPVNPVHDNM